MYIITFTKTASKKTDALICSIKFLSPKAALYLYKSTIRPCMRYCCHGNNRALTSLFLYLLNRVNDPSLSQFHYFLLMFHYCSCLISVLVSLQNNSTLFVVRSLPLYGRSLPFQRNEITDEWFVITLTVLQFKPFRSHWNFWSLKNF